MSVIFVFTHLLLEVAPPGEYGTRQRQKNNNRRVTVAYLEVRKEGGVTRGTFQVYNFNSVQILAETFFTLKISTKYLCNSQRGPGARASLNTPWFVMKLVSGVVGRTHFF